MLLTTSALAYKNQTNHAQRVAAQYVDGILHNIVGGHDHSHAQAQWKFVWSQIPGWVVMDCLLLLAVWLVLAMSTGLGGFT